ncbi:ribonuclease H-like domain-containing protein, partial [Tanacetum coccineum]
SGANQHLTVSTVGIFNVMDISVKITMGQPNGTLATINHFRNLKLTNNVILYDVLVIPGPYKVPSREGFKYFLTIVDDYSKAVWVYLVKTKDEVFDAFVSYIKLIPNQFDIKNKTVRSDNGTEFVNKKMHTMFCDLGIVHQTSCTHTPQQNGIAERKHRHLLNVARSLMFHGGIPLRFWSNCFLTVVYLINRLPSSMLNGLKNDVEFYENNFPFKQKTCDITDVENTSEVDHLKVLDTQMLKSLNDDGKDTSVEDGSMQPLFDTTDSTQGMYQEGWHSATQVDDQNWSEGNVHSNNPSPTQMVDSLDDVQTPSFRRSTRQFKLLVKLNDYVFSSNIKYRIENFVNYSKIKEAMNNEIEALNRITLGLNVIYLMGGNLLGVNGYGKFSTKPLVMLKDTKPDLWLKGLAREKILIMMKHSVMWLKW